jgi:hypothetical protein
MTTRINITTPVGRLVGGSVYEPQTTDYLGKPLMAKDKVTPRVDYSFGVAIPKTAGATHWSQEAWGAPIWALANAEFKNGETQRPDFSSKIIDGDSTIPNKRGKKPADNEGYKGHWVIWFSGGYAPKIYNADGSQQILEPNAIKRGYYVQVFGNVSDNKPSESAGLYVNHTYVALTAYGEEISSAPDVSAAGFGQGVALPAGASNVPAPAFTPAPPAANVPPPPAPVAVAPNPAILNAGVPVPPAPPARQMTALANGATYEQMVQLGWDDTLLIQNGYMLA